MVRFVKCIIANPSESETWLRRAAAQGHQSATAALRKVESANAR